MGIGRFIEKFRLVACGYSQISGVDFTESYAPVINDVCWRILIIAMLNSVFIWGFKRGYLHAL